MNKLNDRIRFALIGFAVGAGGMGIIAGPGLADWVAPTFVAVAVGLAFATAVVNLVEQHRRKLPLFGPEDLDRPGGPYDHLHGRDDPPHHRVK